MSLTINSILNFNSCEVENGFFEPPVSNPNGVNLHTIVKSQSASMSLFQTPTEEFKFHRPCRATLTLKYRISNLYDRKSLQPLNLAFLKQFTRTPSGAFSYGRARL